MRLICLLGKRENYSAMAMNDRMSELLQGFDVFSPNLSSFEI